MPFSRYRFPAVIMLFAQGVVSTSGHFAQQTASFAPRALQAAIASSSGASFAITPGSSCITAPSSLQRAHQSSSTGQSQPKNRTEHSHQTAAFQVSEHGFKFAFLQLLCAHSGAAESNCAVIGQLCAIKFCAGQHIASPPAFLTPLPQPGPSAQYCLCQLQ